jgi:lactate dehydrogenase-like 2-hydroxyacid dehydrogenase
MALAKNIQKSYEMTKVADFSVAGLQCFLLEDKTVGIIETGVIGKKTVQKISGLVNKVVCFDAFPSNDWIKTVPNAEYVSTLDELLSQANMISIHCPLLPETHHLINKETIGKMKKNVILVNTSREEVVNTHDLIDALKSGKIFGAALDVFEGENDFVWRDMSKKGFEHFPDLQELASMHNVIISSHIAFYTDESIRKISEKSLANFEGFIGKVQFDESAFVA